MLKFQCNGCGLIEECGNLETVAPCNQSEEIFFNENFLEETPEEMQQMLSSGFTANMILQAIQAEPLTLTGDFDRPCNHFARAVMRRLGIQIPPTSVPPGQSEPTTTVMYNALSSGQDRDWMFVGRGYGAINNAISQSNVGRPTM